MDLPAIHAWLLGSTLIGALLWRWLPPLSAWWLMPLPLLLAWPASRRSLAAARLALGLILLLLVVHGDSGGPSRSPAALPDLRGLAQEARVLLLRSQVQPGELSALLEARTPDGAAGRESQLLEGWWRGAKEWERLPGLLEAWPRRDGRAMIPQQGWHWVFPGPGMKAGNLLWEPFRSPLGPFSRDRRVEGWSRGRMGRLRQAAATQPLPQAQEPEEASWRTMTRHARMGLVRRMLQGTGEAGPWLAALLLGETGGLPERDLAAFRRTGLTHLLAVSGLNAGVLALVMGQALSLLPLGRGPRALALAVLLLAYVPLAGGEVSVRRAVAMALLLMAGRALERPLSGLSALSLTVVLMLWLDPAELMRPGFQLSCGAVAALLLALPASGRRIGAPVPGFVGWSMTTLRRLGRGMLDGLRLSLAAQAGTVATLLAFFGSLPLSGLVLNLVAIPLSSALTVAGFLHLVLPLPGEPVGALAEGMARLLSSLAIAAPAWSISWRPAPLQVGLLAAASLALVLPRLSLRARSAFATLLLVAAADLLPRLTPTGAFTCLFDVGQGDAVLLRSPGGRTVLVDAGWSNPLAPDTRGDELALAVEAQCPEGLDWLVLTHPDQDHLGGAEGLLKRIHVRRVLWNGEWKANPPQDRLRRELLRQATPLVTAMPGQLLQAEPGWRVRVLGPPPPGHCPEGNERSIVLSVERGRDHLLLTGDAGSEEEAWLAGWGSWLRAGTLKLGHHGSRGSSSVGFLDQVEANAAWISCGRGNSYGHPHPQLLERVQERIPRLHRTDRQGWLWVGTDDRDSPLRAFVRPALDFAGQGAFP